MHALVAVLIPVLVTERFSPDPLITLIVRWIVFICMLIFVLLKLFPLLGF